MNKIEELIQQFCPDGVDFKELGEVCNFLNGKGHEKHIVKSGKYIVVNSKFVSTDGIVKKYSDIQISPIYKEDILMVMSDLPNGKALAKCFIVDKDDTYTLNQRICALSVKDKSVNSAKFLYYLLNRNYQLLRYDSGADQTNLKKDDILKIQIPIPPLPIQQEIVTILDSFTTLEAELEAELEARRAQYKYYRDQLLCFEGKEVEWKTLGEVGYYPKNRIAANLVNETNYVGVDNLLQNSQGKTISSYVPTTGNLIAFKENDVLIGNIRPYLKKIWLSVLEGGTNGDVIVIRINELYSEKYNPRFLYFLLSSDLFFDYDMQFAKGAKMPRGDKEAILRYKIPIPPIEEQERIVSILDKFDALVNDISVGLPAEIEARRKQYEYYREKLLTFKKT